MLKRLVHCLQHVLCVPSRGKTPWMPPWWCRRLQGNFEFPTASLHKMLELAGHKSQEWFRYCPWIAHWKQVCRYKVNITNLDTLRQWNQCKTQESIRNYERICEDFFYIFGPINLWQISYVFLFFFLFFHYLLFYLIICFILHFFFYLLIVLYTPTHPHAHPHLSVLTSATKGANK